MICTLLSWVVIGTSAFLWGTAILSFLEKFNHYEEKKLDMVLMTGLCALTVYAQFFSLFRRVNRAAFMSVIFADAIIVILIKGKMKCWLRKFRNMEKDVFKYRFFAIVGIGILVAGFASGEVRHYDTALYHAQAIHWIEEYGVVPGLGNLHNRLAYNSSFLPLQALFSLKFLTGQSLHSMNGFIMWLLLSYALCSMRFWHRNRIYASDFLRIIIILYYAGKVRHISSPETDAFALGLTAYIFSKWVNLIEDGEKNIAPYAYLCILGVYGVSLKLSMTMVVFLVLFPALKLVTGKRWKEIALYLGFGIVTVMPFLIRNVIISGYLLYPYPEIDLFPVDWKMPAASLIRDRNEIKVWAWNLCDVAKADAPFSVWFPVWRENMGRTDYMLFVINIALVPICLCVGGYQVLKEKRWEFLHISGCMISCMVFWFFTAPLARYGKVFLYLLPFYAIGTLLGRAREGRMIVIAMAAWEICCIISLLKGINVNFKHVIICADYALWECNPTDIGGLQIYIPETGDQTGYYDFPSTPYKSVLEQIELRGGSFSEGFRPYPAER